ncbi:hypothetical protein [Pseudoramibacter sp.]|jgi:hypothetical protein|uniref:hypothetical protein n=1 Tax=Pseudoramibacter sp. TaxID=2034862 RepID=UPI0025F012C7|nr:hypothetical protein [Pseudoramibacter sp.]MCH4072836.1 hypothetical protein [Pseudoramibacter sp.]MCH4106607.1 hypothetical protein [Pseudoramibacter sp.]
MKVSCERCGREIGFFSRAHSFENTKLNIEYHNLCAKCSSLLTDAVSQLTSLTQTIRTTLLKDYQFSNIDSADLDTIIFVSIKTILEKNPHFSDRKDPLIQIFVGETVDEYNSEKMILSKIIKKILDYGFSSNLENAELLSYSKYFNNTTLMLNQIQANCSQSVPQVWTDLILNKRGIVFRQTENNNIISARFPNNEEIRYALKRQDGLQSIQFLNIKYPSEIFQNKNVIVYGNNENQLFQITKLIDYFNKQLKEKEEQKHRLILNQLGERVRNDLRKIFQNSPISTLHVDSVLLILVKNIQSISEIPILDLYNPYGIAIDLLIRDYLTNFLTLGIRTRDEIVEYVQNQCLFISNCNIKLPGLKTDRMWGFFSSRGYIIFLKKANKYLFVFENNYPNDIYYPVNNLIYRGEKYIQIPDNNQHVFENRESNGIIFYSSKIEIIDEMLTFFIKNNSDYQMDQYMAIRQKIYSDRDKILEIKRVTDRLFSIFGYIPFCMYDEWFTIYQEIIKDSPFLKKLLIDHTNLSLDQFNHHTIYTNRITHAFDKGASDLMKTLKINDAEIVKGLMLDYLEHSLIDILSEEWIRINGDDVDQNMSLEQAFEYYLGLSNIEPQKAYYFGLFVYYLINKGVLPKDHHFFENYQRAMSVFIRSQQSLNYDNGIEIPSEMLENNNKE